MRANHLSTKTGLSAAATALVLLVSSNGCGADNRFPTSPDGKYEAAEIRNDRGIHYQVKTVPGGNAVLTTHAQFTTPNDVKSGGFDAGSRLFAAAYHYGHDRYTWIGVFDIATGKQIREVRLEGYVTAIPDSVFRDGK